ncbi:MAG: hypothetical protein CSA53_02100 [Gammaproteobacteria bacterium]|nr:MAG: hypothetical protein CSA53_02100 [Gammaproteobacteria bacterium]
MIEGIGRWYDGIVLQRPLLWVIVLALLTGIAATQLDKIKIEASADSLMLKGDPSLELFREVASRYGSEEFLVLTWQPKGELLGDDSLAALDQMAARLRVLKGVSSVTTVLDVPLLQSPPMTLTDVTSAEGLPSLRDKSISRELALKELTTSVIYRDLLVSRDGKTAAVQINIARDEEGIALLNRREELRKLDARGELSIAQEAELARVSAQVKVNNAKATQAQKVMVQKVRDIAAQYNARDAKVFVGGVPMIAVDMISFVRSDLVTFGSAILAIMTLVLAIIFRQWRWVIIPLLTCISTATLMLGLLGALDWRMTVISSNFVSVLLIVTLAIAIHLVVRYRELEVEMPEANLHDRVLKTVQFMIVPCIYTGLTTIVAFVSLVVSGIQPVIDFGWMMTAGIFVALVVSFIFVPCAIRLWPTKHIAKASGTPTLTARFARIADRFGTTIMLCSVGLMVLSVYGISQLKVENRFIDYFHETTEIYRGMELLDSQLGGTIPLDIVLKAPATAGTLPGLESVNGSAEQAPVSDDEWPEQDVSFDGEASDGAFADEDVFAEEDGFDEGFDSGFDQSGTEDFQPSYWFTLEGMERLREVHRYLDSLEQTGKVLSLDTVFTVSESLMGDKLGSVELALLQNSLPAAMRDNLLEPYFDAAGDEVRISLRAMETSPRLRRDELLKQIHAHLLNDLDFAPENVEMTGMLVLYNNVLQSLFTSQILTLGVVFLVILIMFLLLFHSLSLAFIALAPCLLAAAMVLGIMGLLGIPLDIMTITIAAIVVGIGVDDCIHYVHRFKREYAKDKDYLATMYRCHSSIGNAMYYTTVTVVIGFATLSEISEQE